MRFKHVVIIIQENRTPDNLFGSNPHFEPGVDIATSGPNSKGEIVPLRPLPLANCYDLNHQHIAFVNQYNQGKLDGADKNTTNPSEGCVVPPNPQYHYVDNSKGDVQPYFDMARQWGFANRMFQTNQGPSYAAHLFAFSGTSAPTPESKLFAANNPKLTDLSGCIGPPDQTVDLIDEDGDLERNKPIFPCLEHGTMGDLLNAANVSWKYYAPLAGSLWNAPNAIRHVCDPKTENGKPSCTGADWMAHVVVPSRLVLRDIANCNLANVVWINPKGTQSDHPKSNDGSGPAWVSSIVNAIGTQKCPDGEEYWKDTAIFITWDDWGGWYDHIAPYRIGQDNGWGKAYVYGFRLPLLVISAYTPAGYVDNSVQDYGTILKFVETNFGPPGKPLGPIPPGTFADSYVDNNLKNFFALTSPRPFQPIHVKFSLHLLVFDSMRWVFEEISSCGAGCWF